MEVYIPDVDRQTSRKPEPKALCKISLRDRLRKAPWYMGSSLKQQEATKYKNVDLYTYKIFMNPIFQALTLGLGTQARRSL